MPLGFAERSMTLGCHDSASSLAHIVCGWVGVGRGGGRGAAATWPAIESHTPRDVSSDVFRAGVDCPAWRAA